jgi:hypothetical protein
MLSGLTVAFAGSLALFTNARRQDVFAATAAYAAVLVVFVSGNLATGSDPSNSPSSAVNPAPTVTSTVLTTSTILSTVVSTLSASSTVSSAAGPTASGSSTNGLSTSAKVAIGVGVSLGFVGAVASVAVAYLGFRKKKVLARNLGPI